MCIYVENKNGEVKFTAAELADRLLKEIEENSSKAADIKKEDVIKYAEEFIKENEGLTVSPKWVENILIDSVKELEFNC
jgi:hypothetical protein